MCIWCTSTMREHVCPRVPHQACASSWLRRSSSSGHEMPSEVLTLYFWYALIIKMIEWSADSLFLICAHYQDDRFIPHRTLDHTQIYRRDVGKPAVSHLDRGSMSHHKRRHRACAHQNCQYAGQPQRHKRSTGLALSVGQGEAASGGKIMYIPPLPVPSCPILPDYLSSICVL